MKGGEINVPSHLGNSARSNKSLAPDVANALWSSDGIGGDFDKNPLPWREVSRNDRETLLAMRNFFVELKKIGIFHNNLIAGNIYLSPEHEIFIQERFRYWFGGENVQRVKHVLHVLLPSEPEIRHNIPWKRILPLLYAYMEGEGKFVDMSEKSSLTFTMVELGANVSKDVFLRKQNIGKNRLKEILESQEVIWGWFQHQGKFVIGQENGIDVCVHLPRKPSIRQGDIVALQITKIKPSGKVMGEYRDP